MTSTLRDAARLIRSKNAGPFWMTIDVFLQDHTAFARAARSTLVDPVWMGSLYGVDPTQVEVHLVSQLDAIKISMPRPVPQGSVADTDEHAGQQYVPLLDIELP